jgi:hypothetical protein
MRKLLYTVGTFGFIGSLVLAILHYEFPNDTIRSFSLEAFKISFTFTLIALGGALIKGTIDALLDEQRAQRTLVEQQKERQASIVKEFAEIFSEFYSIRKLYHSAKDHRNLYDSKSTEYAELVRKLLQKSVDLEGRYGALKIFAIEHFALPRRQLSTQRPNLQELKERIPTDDGGINNPERQRDVVRDRLDLLGELYDEWRHSIERDKKICDKIVGADVWKNYEALLQFFAASVPLEVSEARSGKPGDQGRPGFLGRWLKNRSS